MHYREREKERGEREMGQREKDRDRDREIMNEFLFVIKLASCRSNLTL